LCGPSHGNTKNTVDITRSHKATKNTKKTNKLILILNNADFVNGSISLCSSWLCVSQSLFKNYNLWFSP
jgi:hypothetical protein